MTLDEDGDKAFDEIHTAQTFGGILRIGERPVGEPAYAAFIVL